MSNYRRVGQPGGTFFFTVVTAHRRPLLTGVQSRRLLRAALLGTREKYTFETIAFVLLPDHLHTLWRLPQDDGDFSVRWRLIKICFTRTWCSQERTNGPISPSRQRSGEQDVWQRRFWEHRIRDDDDLRRHVEYSHYNPAKHGLVQHVSQWPYSTFYRYVRRGLYPTHWGGA